VSFPMALERAVEYLNALNDDRLREALLQCSGSPAWCERMIRDHPFIGAEDFMAKSGLAWDSLPAKDWFAAFASHPKIGDVENLRKKISSTAAWASAEQAGVSSASEETLNRLAEGNARYEERFGYIFIVCASGKTAEEMLSILNRRLGNPPELELAIAGEEHRKITRLRIEKLQP
jgi:2-oxo-4-hydroxy-4-carboxy-5-ureidoimidazoline decarboxylase